MKKIALLLITTVFAFSVLAACSSGESGPTGTASEIAARIVAEAEMARLGEPAALDDDQKKEFYLGSADYPEFADAAVVAPMINIDTRLLVIIRAADKSDVAAITAKLEENIDPRRLICVTFTLEDVAIESRGDVILMTINSRAEERTASLAAFNNME